MRHPSSGQSRFFQQSRAPFRHNGCGILPLPPTKPFSQNGSTTHSGTHYASRPTCQVIGKMGHTAFNRYHRFHNAFQATGPNLTVYTAALPQPCDLNWYPNTSATHHITFDLNSLNIHSKAYDGIDEIQVGNGSRLAIKNAGISKLSPNFNLHYVLHVLKISKNLLSIQKFTSDNNVYVKFHPSCFFVKDRISRKILHHGLSRHGLYHWFSPTAAPPPLWIGTLTLVIQQIALFPMSCLNFSFLSYQIRS